MGNCLKKQSTDAWDSDDWSFEESEKLIPAAGIRDGGEDDQDRQETMFQEEKLAGGKAGTEVKIKITKKQLEELLGRVNVQGLSIEQLLSQLMSAQDHWQLRHRHWTPTLQSIPEVI